ncbi:Serine carboxypeptidase S28 [Popillia japonica]|uniref:Serine carboxypeptidase S28 n=1 Tax=Popillia japonica TaxID=7064 RepID=A0AAW1IUS4_POPJA
MKETNTNLANSKVVVIGGSYAGTLATWARLKYPHIVDIAYASSAPLRDVADFYEYMEVVGDQIGLQSQECVKTISEAFSQLERKLETAEGIEEMSDRFSMCKTIRTDEPYRSHFLNYVSRTFPDPVQYGTAYHIQFYCQKFLNFTGSSLDKLISLNNVSHITQNMTSALLLDHDYFGSIFDELISNDDVIYIRCVEDYDQFIEEMGNSENNSTGKIPFGNNVDLQYFNHLCTDIYGQA